MNTTNRKSKRARSNEDPRRSPTKRQFRNENEKRRRDLFSQLIGSLEDILHIDQKCSTDDQTTKTSTQTNKLDKASILRETADYLKKHHHNVQCQSNPSSSTSRSTIDRTDEIGDFSWKGPSGLVTIEEWFQTAIESMNCFFLVAKSDPYNAQIVHVSPNISSLLDYSQNELLNRSLFELILPRDHDQLRDYLLKDHRVLEKCHLSWRRATADEYEQCTIIGALRQIQKANEENGEKYLISIVKVNTLDRRLILNNQYSINQFTTRLNLHGKFIHIDSKAREFLGYGSYELIGRTHFDFVHPDDLTIIIRAHHLWKENGNGQSDPYRFLTKGQQWLFIQTHGQLQNNSWTGKPENYLCTSNPLQNPTDSLHRQLSSISSSYQILPSAMESRSTASSMLTINSPSPNWSSDSQITSFLSHLGDNTYRTNIREKLNERRISKQAEIRIREEEMKVIEDIIRFIDEFQSKHSINVSSNENNCSLSFPSPSAITSIHLTNRTIQEDTLNQISEFQSNYDPILLRSPLINPIEGLSPQTSSIISHQNLSKDEIIIDSLSCPLFSPSQQGTFSISSPLTPFSIPSRRSPITPMASSVSPISSPFPQTISPSNNTSITADINSIKPPSVSSISSSSSNSNSSSTTTNPNGNGVSTEQTSKKSSFNRSLPHSLVS